jgi:hypothetical protein
VFVCLAADRIHRAVTIRSGLDLLSLSGIALIVASCSPRAAVANDVTVELTMTPAPPPWAASRARC